MQCIDFPSRYTLVDFQSRSRVLESHSLFEACSEEDGGGDYEILSDDALAWVRIREIAAASKGPQIGGESEKNGEPFRFLGPTVCNSQRRRRGCKAEKRVRSGPNGTDRVGVASCQQTSNNGGGAGVLDAL